MTQTKERPVKPNQAYIEAKQVRIKSYSARDDQYNEILADYQVILDNLKATKIGFLVKNIAGPQIDEEDESESEKEEAPKKGQKKEPDYISEAPAEEVAGLGDGMEIELGMISVKPQPEAAPADREEDLLASGVSVKGPKKKLIQIPKHL